MADEFEIFEGFVRRAPTVTDAPSVPSGATHPFDLRNIHSRIRALVQKLFDNGHYAEATLRAYQYVDKEVARIGNSAESGSSLMQKMFSANAPILKLTPMVTQSEQDEQKGYMWLFTGSVWAIRNPRAHDPHLVDGPDLCLDHLSFASMLLRRIEDAGYR